MQLFAPHIKDFYKAGHIFQYPEKTEIIYSNFTPRSGKYSNIPDNKKIVWVGLQMFMQTHLIDRWNETFFNKPKEEVVAKYKRRISNSLGFEIPVSHIEALHDLGYLPIEIRSLPEGSVVPYKIPVLTIQNTNPDFFWVTNMLETSMSSELWQISTSATTYNAYRLNFLKYAKLTGGDLGFVPFQGHDFSYRGMGIIQGAISGLGAILAGSTGTDTITAIDLAEEYYDANSDEEFIAGSVNATEHSVMCAGGNDGELQTFERLLTKVYPEGILSVVSDTWDFWHVVTDFLPQLKDTILNRNGKLVIRPDSGDPVKIITGYMIDEYFEKDGKFYEIEFTKERSAAGFEYPVPIQGKELSEAELKGLIACLWDTFGGTIVEGEDGHYSLLDSHIGAIYGDSITIERQEQILERLMRKGFCSSNIVLGVGSYTYQMVTRDTHGWAMKATWARIDGKPVEIYKDPKTDDGIKKSAKGLLQVVGYNDGQLLELHDQVTPLQANTGMLEKVFSNGEIVKRYSLKEIRERVNKFEEM